jgi:hypothetical protein
LRTGALTRPPGEAADDRAGAFGWLAFVIAAVVIGGGVGTTQLTDGRVTSSANRKAL